MDKDLLKGIKFAIGFLLVIITFFGIVYAVGFHGANEILSGIFQGNYTFNGNVNFSNATLYGVTSGTNTITIVGNQSIAVDSNTKLLVQSDTTDGSTSFVDSSPTSHTISVSGNVHHETDQAKFGSTSIQFDGNLDMLSISDHSDFNIGSGDFTIDTWMYLTTGYEVDTNIIASQINPNGGSTNLGMYFHINQGDTLAWYYSTDGSFSGWTGVQVAYNFSPNSWYHIAVTRSGGDVRFFVNGTQIGETQTSAGSVYDSSRDFSIGAHTCNVGICQEIFGYLDEFRFSRTARWTSNFVPDTDPYDIGNYVILTDENNNNYTLTYS